MEIWPGSPFPLGATYDGTGTNFSLFSEVAEHVELCLFDDDGTETRLDAPGGHGLRPPRLRARRPARPALRLPGPRPLGPEHGQPLQPGQAADRPLRQGRRRAGRVGRRGVRLPVRRRARRPADGHRLRAVRPQVGGHQPLLRLGRRPPAPHPVARDRRLRDPRQGAHGHATPTCLPSCAAPTRAVQPPGHRPPRPTRRHRGRADAGAPVHPRPPPRRAGARQLLGLQLHRLPRPAQRLRRATASVASRCRSSSRW